MSVHASFAVIRMWVKVYRWFPTQVSYTPERACRNKLASVRWRRRSTDFSDKQQSGQSALRSSRCYLPFLTSPSRPSRHFPCPIYPNCHSEHGEVTSEMMLNEHIRGSKFPNVLIRGKQRFLCTTTYSASPYHEPLRTVRAIEGQSNGVRESRDRREGLSDGVVTWYVHGPGLAGMARSIHYGPTNVR